VVRRSVPELGAGEDEAETGFGAGSAPVVETGLLLLAALRERRRIRWFGSGGFSKLSSAGSGEGSDEAAEDE
jgi:hypothetical protein